MKRFWIDAVLIAGMVMAASAYACAAGHSTVLTWGASVDSGVTYNVYRVAGSCPASGIPTGATKITSGLAVLTFTDPNVSAGNVFAYYVTAQLNGVESGPTNCADATTPVGAPGTLAAVPH